MTERALTESQQRFAELPGLYVLTDAPASSFPSGARELRLGTPTGGGPLSRSCRRHHRRL